MVDPRTDQGTKSIKPMNEGQSAYCLQEIKKRLRIRSSLRKERLLFPTGIGYMNEVDQLVSYLLEAYVCSILSALLE